MCIRGGPDAKGGIMSIIIIAGMLPAFILLYFIYKQDKIEKEPMGLIIKLFILGGLMTIPAGIAESFFIPIAMNLLAGGSGLLFLLVENFLIVGLAEEGFKRLVMRGLTWNHPAFNYRFDGVVYGVAVSLGFAAFENVMYVMGYGLGIAPIRAVTAIPLHCIVGVFMGHYYGMSRFYAVRGKEIQSRRNQKLSLWVPVLIHGLYDFAAVAGSPAMEAGFLAFIVILDIIAISAVRRFARNDQPA